VGWDFANIENWLALRKQDRKRRTEES
jgi:hypothetical protein